LRDIRIESNFEKHISRAIIGRRTSLSAEAKNRVVAYEWRGRYEGLRKRYATIQEKEDWTDADFAHTIEGRLLEPKGATSHRGGASMH